MDAFAYILPMVYIQAWTWTRGSGARLVDMSWYTGIRTTKFMWTLYKECMYPLSGQALVISSFCVKINKLVISKKEIHKNADEGAPLDFPSKINVLKTINISNRILKYDTII